MASAQNVRAPLTGPYPRVASQPIVFPSETREAELGHEQESTPDGVLLAARESNLEGRYHMWLRRLRRHNTERDYANRANLV